MVHLSEMFRSESGSEGKNERGEGDRYVKVCYRMFKIGWGKGLGRLLFLAL
jgi:hypothetical protein